MRARALLQALMVLGALFTGGCANHGAMSAKETDDSESPGQAAARYRKACDGGTK